MVNTPDDKRRPGAAEVGLPEFASDAWIQEHSDSELGLGHIRINDERFGLVHAEYIDQWQFEEEWNLLCLDSGTDAAMPFVREPEEERWKLYELQVVNVVPQAADGPPHSWSLTVVPQGMGRRRS